MRWMRFPGFKGKALTLSYDDGVVQDIRLVEIMKKYGIKGTFNLNSGIPAGGRRIELSEAIRLCKDNGMEVAAHGYTHASLTAVTAPEVISEVFRDRVELEKATGEIIRGMAYAYGAVNDSVVQCLKDAGILYCRTTASTRQFSIPQDLLRLPATCHHNDRELMALAKRFVEIPLRNDAMLFYLWGHSYEFDDNNNWNVIEEFCELVSGNDSIWYATNREIMEYITDYRALIPSADGSTIYNPTARTLFFVAKGNEYVVEPGKSVKIS